MRKLTQYFILKISTSHLKRKNYNLELSIAESRRNGELVSLGDSQLLRSLRKLKGQDFSQEQLMELQEEKKKLKRKKSNQENISRLIEIENKIDGILFIPEIISLSVDNINHYKKIGINGFWVNGIHFVRLMCGAGQARRNNALFISESFEKPLKDILNNNRNLDVEIVPAKYNAYFSLASSSSLSVSEPYFCVVPDKEVVRTEKVDYIEEQERGDDIILEKEVEITFNLWDGQGIISPRKAKEWAEELGLDYIPSCFIIRSNFIKGMLAVIDFHKFSDEIGEHFILDVWGNKVNIRDMDIILTQSQFKLWNAYENCYQFISSCRENDLQWSVTRVSPRKEKDYCFLNYQFIQALELTDESIARLCQPTIEYFQNILGGSIENTLLYLLGKHTQEFDEDIFEKIDDVVTKSLILNNELINDPYIRSHILGSLNKKIRDSYMGNLIVDGNYSMMVADPYAFLEYLFNLPISGLLSRDEHYSKYWLDKKENKISAMRAPLTWRSEVLTLNLKNNKNMDDWFRYLNNCIIFNVFGVDDLLAGGSDKDGDIICTTNNKEILNGSCGGLPIYYEPKKAEKSKVVETDLYLWDIKGFNSKVGYITNCATSAFSLLPLFEKDSPEYSETIKRLKIFRKEQGNTIDAAKGLVVKPFPIHWTRWNRILETMSEETKNELEFKNRVVIDKRPLFMRWVYTHYNRKYLDYNKNKDSACSSKFNKNLLLLLAQYKNNCELSEKELKFVKDYYKYNLFIESDCLMNKVSLYMESKIKEVKISHKEKISTIDILKNKDIKTDPDKLKLLYDIYKKYRSEKKNFSKILNDNGFQKYKTIEQFNKAVRLEAISVSSNVSELVNLAVDICYIIHPSDNKHFLWGVFSNDIVENIMLNRQETMTIPVQTKQGAIKFLGKNYSMKEIKIEKEEPPWDEYL